MRIGAGTPSITCKKSRWHLVVMVTDCCLAPTEQYDSYYIMVITS